MIAKAVCSDLERRVADFVLLMLMLMLLQLAMAVIEWLDNRSDGCCEFVVAVVVVPAVEVARPVAIGQSVPFPVVDLVQFDGLGSPALAYRMPVAYLLRAGHRRQTNFGGS